VHDPKPHKLIWYPLGCWNKMHMQAGETPESGDEHPLSYVFRLTNAPFPSAKHRGAFLAAFGVGSCNKYQEEW